MKSGQRRGVRRHYGEGLEEHAWDSGWGDRVRVVNVAIWESQWALRLNGARTELGGDGRNDGGCLGKAQTEVDG